MEQRKEKVEEPYIIEIEDLCKKYGKEEEEVLSNVNLKIRKGEFHILLGASGCGKSTLLNIIAGFLRKTSGSVRINGKEVKKAGKERGVVFQNADRAIFPWLTVEENVGYGARINKVKKEERKKLVKYYVNLVGLNGHEKKYPNELSGGMKLIFVTHDIQEAILLGERVSILSKSPGADIYKTYDIDLPYPRMEAGKEYEEWYWTLKGHFGYGGGI